MCVADAFLKHPKSIHRHDHYKPFVSFLSILSLDTSIYSVYPLQYCSCS